MADDDLIPIDDLIPDAANARTHGERNRKVVADSIKRFGAARSIVIDGKGIVRAGNATLEAAKAAGITHVRIVQGDPNVLLAARRADWNETEATVYAITDNQSTVLGKWNTEILVPILDALPDDLVELTGFDPIEIAEFRSLDNGEPDGEQDGDDEDDDTEVIPSLEERYGPLPPPSGLLAPFPYFGGKLRIAPLVWKRFGDVRSYVEPFAGSLAVLLNRPSPFDGPETVNDLDGMISNFWRALQTDPEGVAKHADWPINENDLHARHAWLVERKNSFQERLEGDPDYFDAKVAGWWVWGICCWIGSGWCEGDGPWSIVTAEDGSRQLVNLGNEGQGVSRRLVSLSDGRGVNRKRVHLTDEGQSVNRQLVNLGSQGQGINRQRVHLIDEGQSVNQSWTCQERTDALLAIMRQLADRLRMVRVCCGDWTRICGGKDGDAISHLIQKVPCGVFLDPPYSDLADRNPSIYRKEDLQVAHAVREWAIAHGDDERFRIALCGYEGEHEMPASWECVEWKAHGGMANLSEESQGLENAKRERIWFSPYCLR